MVLMARSVGSGLCSGCRRTRTRDAEVELLPGVGGIGLQPVRDVAETALRKALAMNSSSRSRGRRMCSCQTILWLRAGSWQRSLGDCS